MRRHNKAKKSSFVLEIAQVKMFSNVYQNIYFLLKNSQTHTNNKQKAKKEKNKTKKAKKKEGRRCCWEHFLRKI